MDKKEKVDSTLKPEERLNNILDKMLKLQAGKKGPTFLQKVVYIIAGISVLAFVALICITLYKNSFTTESILSTLLAFFSIFISIFFYFKADETSSKFYDSSYRFMKDISVTLGKIEERFGEKLNNLNDKIAHLDKESNETTEQIDDKQDDRNLLTYNILEHSNMDATEKEKYRQKIEEKDKEIDELRRQRRMIQNEADMLRRKITTQQRTDESNTTRTPYRTSYSNLTDIIALTVIEDMVSTGTIPDEIPPLVKRSLLRRGCIDGNGNINMDELHRYKSFILRKLQPYNTDT